MEYPQLPESWARGLDSLVFSAAVQGPLTALAELGSVAAPSDCVYCRSPDAVMCRTCRGAFRAATVRPFEAQEGAESLPLDPGGEPLPVMAAGIYSREVSAAVLAFKNRQRVSLAGVLGPALAGALRLAADRFDSSILLVPIPSTRLARAHRGYAPVDVLLAWIQRRALLPPSTTSARLLRVRPGPPWAGAAQKSKGRRARAGSAAKMVLLPHPRIPDRPVLLVDDVLTTGATLARAHHQLQAAGVRVEGAVVVAATAAPRHHEGSDLDEPGPIGADTPAGGRAADPAFHDFPPLA